MIPLRLRATSSDRDCPPYLVRAGGGRHSREESRSAADAFLERRHVDDRGQTVLSFRTLHGHVDVEGLEPDEIEGDVLLIVPRDQVAHRLIRAKSPHNTLLITEQCDQLCVMCSQPPKKAHTDLFPFYRHATLLAPPGTTIGLSGGEPTLHKDKLFSLIAETLSRRPDLTFHVLTNGQHFESSDRAAFARWPRDRVLWGIPLYASHATLHDDIVDKAGAFDRLCESLALLGRFGARIELRTVVMQPNAQGLPAVASYIANKVPFVSFWALMQLENIGFGRMNWPNLFYDSGKEFGPIGEAMDISFANGINATLYNFPLCTVPEYYRDRAVRSISDWKQRYLDACSGCSLMNDCGGFFQWYPEEIGFGRIGLE